MDGPGRQKPAEQGAAPAADRPGIFVLSLPRTGSTLLRVILDTHPDIFCPDELNLGRLLDALYDTNEGLAELSRTGPRLGAVEVDPASSPARATRRIVSHLLAAAARRKGKSLWCDKSPNNFEHRELIAKLLPDAQFILLHRHCLDFAMSCLRACLYGFFLGVVEEYVRKDHKNTLRAVIRAWEETTRELLAFEAEHGKRCLRLRYEDLVTAPAESLGRICEFLGVELDPRILERVFTSPHPQRASHGDPAVLYARTVVDRSIGTGANINPAMMKTLPEDLWRRMNEVLERLGYPAVELTARGFDMHFGRGSAATLEPAAAAARPQTLATPGARAGMTPADAPPLIAAEFFAALAERLRAEPELAGRVNGSFKFVLTGRGGGTWVLDLTRPPGDVIPDGAAAQCVITTSSTDFAQIVTGKDNAASAFREGRLVLQGPAGEDVLRELVGILVRV
jgi:protein-tyrosine sulfotransferase